MASHALSRVWERGGVNPAETTQPPFTHLKRRQTAAVNHRQPKHGRRLCPGRKLCRRSAADGRSVRNESVRSWFQPHPPHYRCRSEALSHRRGTPLQRSIPRKPHEYSWRVGGARYGAAAAGDGHPRQHHGQAACERHELGGPLPVRDHDGVTRQLEYAGRTKARARAAIQDAIKARQGTPGGSTAAQTPRGMPHRRAGRDEARVAPQPRRGLATHARPTVDPS